MSFRRRNWFLKRLVLGFAVAGLVVPAAAQARVDEGLKGLPNSIAEISKGSTAQVGPSGLPHAGLNEYLKGRDGIEMARLNPRSTVRNSDLIEQVRVSPREVSTPQVVSSPGFDWSDAGIGAGFVLGLVLVGGAAFVATRRLGRPQTA